MLSVRERKQSAAESVREGQMVKKLDKRSTRCVLPHVMLIGRWGDELVG